MLKYIELPNKFKNKPRNTIFKLKDSKYTFVDCLISKYYWCDNCNRMFNNKTTITKWSKLQKYFKKCSCGNTKPTYRYSVQTCEYTDNCTIKRWDCRIHSKGVQHSFTCTCDICY